MPEGWSQVVYDGRRWGVTRTVLAGGRAQKVYAEELGGRGVVSANLYGGDRFRPCEMPAATVIAFLRGLEAVDRPRRGRVRSGDVGVPSG